MPLSSKLFFDCEVTTSGKDDTPKSASKTNPKGVTTNFTTSSGKGGTSKGFTSSISNVKAGVSGYEFNTTSGYDLSSTYTRTNGTAWGFAICWSNNSDYSDKYILDGGTNGNHMRFVDASTLEFRGGGSKGTATSLALNNTNNSTTSYTLTSDVECLVVQVSSGSVVKIWNIDGALIFNSSSAVAGAVASFVVESLFHDNTFAKSPPFLLHNFLSWEGSESDANLSTFAASFASYKD